MLLLPRAFETASVMNKLDTLKKSFESQKAELTELRQYQVDSRKEEWPLISGQKITEIAAMEVEKKLDIVSKDLHYVTKTLSEAKKDVSEEKVTEAKKDVAEEKVKEDRKNNIILYNIPEQVAGTIDEKLKSDKLFVLELFNALNTGVDEEDIKKRVRLGKKVDTGKSRPLLLQFGGRLAKSLVMDTLFRLKNIHTKFNNITVSHDMTKKEREECKSLVEEAKDKKQQDVSGGMVVPSEGPTRPDEDYSHKEKEIRILYTNADSLHNKLQELEVLLKSLKYEPQVIAITEVNNKINSILLTSEYHLSG